MEMVCGVGMKNVDITRTPCTHTVQGVLVDCVMRVLALLGWCGEKWSLKTSRW